LIAKHENSHFDNGEKATAFHRNFHAFLLALTLIKNPIRNDFQVSDFVTIQSHNHLLCKYFVTNEFLLRTFSTRLTVFFISHLP
jgi:hypothetical protein